MNNWFVWREPSWMEGAIYRGKRSRVCKDRKDFQIELNLKFDHFIITTDL